MLTKTNNRPFFLKYNLNNSQLLSELLAKDDKLNVYTDMNTFSLFMKEENKGTIFEVKGLTDNSELKEIWEKVTGSNDQKSVVVSFGSHQEHFC